MAVTELLNQNTSQNNFNNSKPQIYSEEMTVIFETFNLKNNFTVLATHDTKSKWYNKSNTTLGTQLIVVIRLNKYKNLLESSVPSEEMRQQVNLH